MLPNQIIILGGGSSVRYLNAIDDGLFLFLQDKFCIGINYSYKFVNTTCNLGIDPTLYEGMETPETQTDIAKLPLWIGKSSKDIKHPQPHHVFLTPGKEYKRDLSGGVYRASLSGIFALSLSIRLLDFSDGEGTIYLLGYDGGAIEVDGQTLVDSQNRPLTHWYQENFTHRGIAKTSWYKQTGFDTTIGKRLPYFNLEYHPFLNEKKVKIINVGGTSNISLFPHITYKEFFNRQFDIVNNQDKLREELREVLCQIKQTHSI